MPNYMMEIMAIYEHKTDWIIISRKTVLTMSLLCIVRLVLFLMAFFNLAKENRKSWKKNVARPGKPAGKLGKTKGFEIYL